MPYVDDPFIVLWELANQARPLEQVRVDPNLG